MTGLLSRLERNEPERGRTPREEHWFTQAEVSQRLQELLLGEYSQLVEASRIDPARKGQLRGVVSTLLVREELAVKNKTREELAEELTNEIVGYGPLETLLADESITEIMVNGPTHIYVERLGQMEETKLSFRDRAHLEGTIQKMIAPLGRRLDQNSPFVDARLPDGSRINAIIPPLALDGPVLTIRRFTMKTLETEEMVRSGTFSQEMADFLAFAVRIRLNVLVSGGTGTGKTTLLNFLSHFIPAGRERIITIEDSAELQLRQSHVVRLETRASSLEGKGEVTIRSLLRNALRMRPDRIIIGEVRGPEALDLLWAMNSGHEGSLSTIHANSPQDALYRLENMVLMAKEELPQPVVREQIRSAIDVIVHLARFRGNRRVMLISLVDKNANSPQIKIRDLFRYQPQEDASSAGGHRRAADIEPPENLLARARLAGILPPVWLPGR
ncbi:MAG: CpaF family protein [Firmicutes bacterium]|nr:CpaF family protein [Bacillota bacterium]MCL5039833.1 CpaF family protein [Bacillota bacterium]